MTPPSSCRVGSDCRPPPPRRHSDAVKLTSSFDPPLVIVAVLIHPQHDGAHVSFKVPSSVPRVLVSSGKSNMDKGTSGINGKADLQIGKQCYFL